MTNTLNCHDYFKNNNIGLSVKHLDEEQYGPICDLLCFIFNIFFYSDVLWVLFCLFVFFFLVKLWELKSHESCTLPNNSAVTSMLFN